MELFSAIRSDLVSRSLSFMIDRYRKEPSVDHNLRRLHQLLLRIRTIVEEAEGRNVTNQGMIRQLKVLREEMFRGYCVLDAFKYRTLGGDESRDDEQEVSRSFALSSFNQAKRIRFSIRNTASSSVSSVVSMKDLQKMVCGLEDIIGDTKEFVVFLMSYPPMYRQPYSMHLYLDKCMFSRHMEREHVIGFLLSRDHLCDESVEVLPVVGPALVGKSTLVENVCDDERVRNHFSLILYHSAENLDDEKVSTFSETCVTKHQNDAADDGRVLVIIELLGDADDEAWKKLLSSSPHPPQGSKIIITSQSEKITRLGTTQAVRLQHLQFEAFWYFFKVLVFGSTDPEEHPRLASMAMEIATELRGCFLCAHIGGALLRANFTAQFWRRFLAFTREYTEKDPLTSCCGSQDVISTKDHPRYGWAIAKPKPAKYFLLRNSYQKALVQDDDPKITLLDLLFGSVKRRGRFEVLVWRSHIPPYYSYISNCTLL
ncbi:unnamed protein product [Urochloa humidicola]